MHRYFTICMKIILYNFNYFKTNKINKLNMHFIMENLKYM